MAAYKFITNEISSSRASFTFTFDQAALQMTLGPGGMQVAIKGLETTGQAGGPGLPSVMVTVALPPLTALKDVKTKSGKSIQLLKDPVLIAPVQWRPVTFPAGPPEPSLPPKTLPEKIAPLPYVPPREYFYDSALRQPKPLARLVKTALLELTTTATFEINPLRLTVGRLLEFYPEITVTLTLAKISASAFQPVRPPAYGRRLAELSRALVVNPEIINPQLYDLSLPHFDYLIITDDQTWDEKKMTPTGNAGKLTEAFQRLLNWKNQRGLATKLVTISELVSGQLSRDDKTPFTRGANGLPAADLQEVIRNFIKWALNAWSISWVLLGGDVIILPTRLSHSAEWANGFDITRGTLDPPAKDSSFWAGTFLKLQTSTLESLDYRDALLVCSDTGAVIPYDPAGTAACGWHYTDSTYTQIALPPAPVPNSVQWLAVYIRVNWPPTQQAQLNQLNWIFAWAQIATDFYYASLRGAQYDLPGKHDWYLIENGVFAKSGDSFDFDGVEYRADVSIGRAPASNAAEANIFVDKIINYEQFRAAKGDLLDVSWPGELALLATAGCERTYLSNSTLNPLPVKSYGVQASGYALLHIDPPNPNQQNRLFSEVARTQQLTPVPYNPQATLGLDGWFYAVNQSAPPVPSLNSLGGALPTAWIVVFSTTPAWGLNLLYVLDELAPDGLMEDLETLRKQLANDCPQINTLTRLYEDDIDLPASEQTVAPHHTISQQGVTDLLDHGTPLLPHPPHWVALAGHGNRIAAMFEGDEDMLETYDAVNFKNGPYTYIVNADTCLTGMFDWLDAQGKVADCLGAVLIKNPKGGAVAYVGHSRICSLGYARWLQLSFFSALTKSCHLGVLHDARLSVVAFEKKGIYSLNLLGDPEMPVWLGSPDTLTVSHPACLSLAPQPFTVNVEKYGLKVPNALVCLTLDGERLTGETDAVGTVVFQLAPLASGVMAVVVTSPNCIPYLGQVQLGRRLNLRVTPTQILPGTITSFEVDVAVDEAGSPVSDVTISLSTPAGWRGQYTTGTNGCVSFLMDPVPMYTHQAPTDRPGADGFLLVCGWLKLEAAKPGFVVEYAEILIGIYIPKLPWFRPTIKGLKDWLHWPEKTPLVLPGEVRSNPAVRELAASAISLLNLLASISAPNEGKKISGEKVMAQLLAASSAARKSLLELNKQIQPK